MNAKERIINLLKQTDEWLDVSTITSRANISHLSYASKILKQLASEQKVIHRRNGHQVLYRQNYLNIFYEDNLNLTTINEDRILARAKDSDLYNELVNDQADTIFSFAFTEMLNNAKDHSRSAIGYTKIWEEKGKLKFIVRDHGIGVFRNIKINRHLANETEAIQDLVKGKVTTAPRHHSGEGIFWTSKMADCFNLASYDYTLHINNIIDDYSIEVNSKKENSYIIGTEVYFEISSDTTKSISDIFKNFSLDHDTYSFNTTEVPLKLYTGGDFWVSRSQAKRVLAGLDKYQKIILDFNGIDLIGQGFADEIFRVFQISHPNILIEPINMNENVHMMITRAKNDPTGRS